LLLNLTQTQNERLRNFAYIVSHNLRSHTVNIQSLLEILIETQPDLKSLEMTGLLMQVADNLLETIHHLSDVALMNTDDAKDTTTINLYERTQRAIENVSAMAMHHQVEIINNLNGNEQIKGVPAYIDSIVLNFLTNGIRYRATDRKPFVKITSEMDGKYLILKISDNGLGIDLKRHGSKIFGMYKTFHKNPESRGVGLFMTKNQVEAMGGKIEVESEVDLGTTFKIYFQHA
jgi:signal transduction histidine kinase